jgi:hypothetical protein
MSIKTITFSSKETRDFINKNGIMLSRAVNPQPEPGMNWKGLYQIADDRVDLPDCLCPFEVGSTLLLREQIHINDARREDNKWWVEVRYLSDNHISWMPCPFRLYRASGPLVGVTFSCFMEAVRYSARVTGVGLEHEQKTGKWNWLLQLGKV